MRAFDVRGIVKVISVVAVSLLLSACAGGTTTIVPNGDPVAEVEAPEQEVLEVAPAEEAPTGSSAELGTRENPLPLGTAVVLDDGMGGVWEITLLPPTLEANQLVQDENMFNGDPPEGFQYALLPVSAKYLGDETGTPAWDLEFAFVSKAGTTHKEFDVSVVGPEPLSGVNELYKDAVGVGNIVVAIPTLDAELGTWRVGTSWSETAAFFTAQ
jgi:hypothetical protein